MYRASTVVRRAATTDTDYTVLDYKVKSQQSRYIFSSWIYLSLTRVVHSLCRVYVYMCKTENENKNI